MWNYIQCNIENTFRSYSPEEFNTLFFPPFSLWITDLHQDQEVILPGLYSITMNIWLSAVSQPPLSFPLSNPRILFPPKDFNSQSLFHCFSKCINFMINLFGSLGISDVCILCLCFSCPPSSWFQFSSLL